MPLYNGNANHNILSRRRASAPFPTIFRPWRKNSAPEVEEEEVHFKEDELKKEDSPPPQRATEEPFKTLLKCTSCRKALYPPIVQCLAGHMVCRKCANDASDCADCGAKVVRVPARFAEAVAETFEVECAFRDLGCDRVLVFKQRAEHEEICPFKRVQCPEFDCDVEKPMDEILKHFRIEHQRHFVNARGASFHGDIRCDDGDIKTERKWAPTMLKLESVQYFFLEILRTPAGAWHMWLWYLGEPHEADAFSCSIAIRSKRTDEDAELKFTGAVHSIRLPPHRVVLSGRLLSYSDCTAKHFRGRNANNEHYALDYKVSVWRKSSSSSLDPQRRIVKMFRRFSVDDKASTAEDDLY